MTNALDPATQAPQRAGRREWIGLAVLALACLLYVMDLTVLHLAVPAISEDLQPTSAQLLWIIDIYGFMVAGFLVTMGTLGDRIGRRKLLLIGAAAFGAVSILAAFSTSAEMLIASRALLGIAGATLAPSTLSLIFAMFQDPGQRTRAVAVWISAFSAGGAIGPDSRRDHARAVLVGLRVPPRPAGHGAAAHPRPDRPARVQGPGCRPARPVERRLCRSSRSCRSSSGSSRSPRMASTRCRSPRSCLGLVVGALFVRRQFTLADPMIDLRLFRIPAFSAALAVNVLAIFVAVGYFLFVAQYLQLVLGLSPLEAGLWSVPSAIGVHRRLEPRAADRPHRPAGLPDGRRPGDRRGRPRAC